MKGVLIVISGPSGTGKGTVCQNLCKLNPNLHCSVSVTTRAPRLGEKDHESYFFFSENRFRDLVEQGAFLEWASVYGNYYGTLRQQVEEKLDKGLDVILEIDTQGAEQIRQSSLDAIYIFLLPPSMEELWRRIKGRGTDGPEAIRQRFASARKELEEIWKYDYAVLNENVPEAVKSIEAIISAEKCRIRKDMDILSRYFKEGEQGDLPLY
ncbi:MAG: guanylate kinase [Firmicutes bacterium]|nr:guanylate kinase [Bacillota bacterium]